MARMMRIRFEWDPRKEKLNKRKHGVTFELAKQVFGDSLMKLELEGYDHGEERWHAIGQVGGTVLVVSCTIREAEDEEIVRVISARKSEPQERRSYERDT